MADEEQKIKNDKEKPKKISSNLWQEGLWHILIFLAYPLTAVLILVLFSDNVSEMKPWGMFVYLLHEPVNILLPHALAIGCGLGVRSEFVYFFVIGIATAILLISWLLCFAKRKSSNPMFFIVSANIISLFYFIIPMLLVVTHNIRWCGE